MFKIIIKTSVKVGKTSAIEAVWTQLLKGSALLHEDDPGTAFLPRATSTIGIPIYHPTSFPEKTVHHRSPQLLICISLLAVLLTENG
jgi:hypothetical protein